jgi:hypothetical protein
MRRGHEGSGFTPTLEPFIVALTPIKEVRALATLLSHRNDKDDVELLDATIFS